MIEYSSGLPGPRAGGGRGRGDASVGSRPAHCGIVPPYLLAALAMCDDPTLAARAVRTLERDAAVRQDRLNPQAGVAAGPAAAAGQASISSESGTGLRTASGTGPATESGDPVPHRTIADADNGETLPGRTVRSEGDPAVADAAVNQAFDGLGATWDLYYQEYRRNSLDGKGLPLLASVHYSHDYDNAYWDGTQMVFGDGDGKVFGAFTASVDVIGHELTHGVTDYTAGLRYQGQSGALNESISDVFGVLVKQRLLGQSADQADWLIGADLLMPGVDGVALRSMKAPGTAYDDPVLGKDPQPDSMSGYVNTTADNGGVHINSGIPNRAFYLAATGIGGQAWSGAGAVWYAVLTGGPIRADCDFVTFAGLTIDAAGAQFGAGSEQQSAVRSGWEQVGVLPPGGTRRATGSAATPAAGPSPTGHHPPAADARLTVRRSGGFAGRTVEHTVRLADLPREDATQWQALLSGRLQQLPAGRPQPDRFVYQVELSGAESTTAPASVTLAEQDLPSDVLGLLNRAFRRS
ncbi:protealysin inhibitor emfourin [Nakamurella lactea]|uniref:protealysin inhibitor emfourin n=1 Tax=Nakamurella lactea TaxID=459515 RepID=UPI000406F8E9|nr:protealysin inhibitor emfourin [Nakamurella lactea]